MDKFLSLCKNSAFENAGLLAFNDGYYKLVLSYNLDSENVLSSFSTKSFWEGTVNNHDYNIVNDSEDISCFYQLFSENLRENICNLVIKKTFLPTSDMDYIFFAINCDLDVFDPDAFFGSLEEQNSSIGNYIKQTGRLEQIYNDDYLQENIDENLQENYALSFEIDFSSAKLENNIIEGANIDIFASYLQNEILNIFPLPNICKKDLTCLKCIYYCDDKELDIDMFKYHFISKLESVLGKPCADSLVFSEFKIIDSKDEALYFILG
ncbi:MAG: hypothetical protein ACTTHG_01475 [Treponemataceae bacterium]